jgi:hypothetical protein
MRVCACVCVCVWMNMHALSTHKNMKNKENGVTHTLIHAPQHTYLRKSCMRACTAHVVEAELLDAHVRIVVEQLVELADLYRE